MPQESKPKQPRKPFEDVHSDSGGEPRRPDFIQNRLNEEWDLPQWERPRRGTGLPEEEEPLPDRDPHLPREPIRRPEKRKSRRPLAVLIILVMAVITALAVIFLVFKVRDIRVTGTLPEGVSVQQVLDASGVELEENLVFLSAKAVAQRIPAALPTVQEVRPHKRLPTTLELEVIPATPAAALTLNGTWLLVSDRTKILSQSPDPGTLLKVLAPAPKETAPGSFLSFEDDALTQILTTVLSTLPAAVEESGLTGPFTLLDLRDSNALSLYYEDRVELRLGSAYELEYKLKAGCRFLADPTAGEAGVLDLTSTPETKRGVMTAGAVLLPELPGQTPAPTPAPTPDPDATPSPRDKDIPDTIFTGEPTPTPEPPPADEPVSDEPAYDQPSDDPDWTDSDGGDSWDEGGETSGEE